MWYWVQRSEQKPNWLGKNHSRSDGNNNNNDNNINILTDTLHIKCYVKSKVKATFSLLSCSAKLSIFSTHFSIPCWRAVFRDNVTSFDTLVVMMVMVVFRYRHHGQHHGQHNHYCCLMSKVMFYNRVIICCCCCYCQCVYHRNFVIMLTIFYIVNWCHRHINHYHSHLHDHHRCHHSDPDHDHQSNVHLMTPGWDIDR